MSNREIAKNAFKIWEKNWRHGIEMTIPARDAFLDAITAALNEKDLQNAQLEKDLINARQELDALRIRSAERKQEKSHDDR